MASQAIPLPAGPVSTHNAAVLLIVHLLHLQTVRLCGTGWGGQEVSGQASRIPILRFPAPPATPPMLPGHTESNHLGHQVQGKDGGLDGDPEKGHLGYEALLWVQRPEGLRNSKAIRFKSQEMLWGLEGVAQRDSICLACIRPKWLVSKSKPKDTVCGGAGQTIKPVSSLKPCCRQAYQVKTLEELQPKA